MGMIAPDTRESDYVLFELAAAWSHRRLICPLLVRGARSADIPEPIRDRHSLRISDPRDCHELLDELERSTSLQRKRGVGGDVSDKVHRLVELASIIR
jgi:hypothetical protein